jgi:hypothetical protein
LRAVLEFGEDERKRDVGLRIAVIVDVDPVDPVRVEFRLPFSPAVHPDQDQHEDHGDAERNRHGTGPVVAMHPHRDDRDTV